MLRNDEPICIEQHGKTALEAVLKAVTDQEAPMVPPPKDYGGNFLQGMFSVPTADSFQIKVCHGMALGREKSSCVLYTGHKRFSFLCRQQRIVGQKRENQLLNVSLTVLFSLFTLSPFT